MKIECPVCKSKLIREWVYDGSSYHEISPDGSVVEMSEEINGDERIYCSKDENHELPSELISKVSDLVDAI